MSQWLGAAMLLGEVIIEAKCLCHFFLKTQKLNRSVVKGLKWGGVFCLPSWVMDDGISVIRLDSRDKILDDG